MKFFAFFSMALSSILANKLRSALTMLGIVIGVGAVITLVSVGRGAQASVTDIYQGLGTNVLFVQARNPEAPGLAGLSPAFTFPTLTLADARAIADIPQVTSVAPTSQNFVDVSYGDQTKLSVIHGSTPAYLEAFNNTVAIGQFITDRDVSRRDTVIVLGSAVAQDLFGSRDPIGQTVKIKSKNFTVIGVLAPKGGALFGMSLDDMSIVPITTYQTKLFAQRTAAGEDAVQSIAIQVANSSSLTSVQEEVQSLLRKRHRIQPDKKNDFAVVSQQQVLGVFEQITGVFTLFLASIASISLLVGSIGIMNIMLVSVTERTREIGLRKAIGAKRRDILFQFLLEAAMLSLVGGGIGMTGGWLISELISRIDFGGTVIRATVSPDIVILAISVSVFIGIASGMYPALRAARLNPIQALRYG